MREEYHVYHNGFPEGSLFKKDIRFDTLEEAVEYAKELIEDYVYTVHTQVRKIMTETVWDSAGSK